VSAFEFLGLDFSWMLHTSFCDG